jgi:hypothetical protein
VGEDWAASAALWAFEGPPAGFCRPLAVRPLLCPVLGQKVCSPDCGRTPRLCTVYRIADALYKRAPGSGENSLIKKSSLIYYNGLVSSDTVSTHLRVTVYLYYLGIAAKQSPKEDIQCEVIRYLLSS